MPGDRHRIQQYLKTFDFRTLFVDELGWDNLRERALTISLDNQVYFCTPLVEKRGVKVYLCVINAQTDLPDRATLRKIEREITRYSYEHILIYSDSGCNQQIWQWVKRERGKPAITYFHRLSKHQSGELLAQKLTSLIMSIEEEQDLDVFVVSERARQAFGSEPVTKRFYERFKVEREAFLTFIEGITERADREWYASLMLNRLMFVYFIQKKGFLDTTRPEALDGDPNYLSHRLEMLQRRGYRDRFHSFYRYFLLKLFHEGLGSRHRSPELERLLGRVPYLNGGLFDIHELERDYSAIHIPDEAFERLFTFFNDFDWQLDTRPFHSEREINPDVIGYIFEKYINDKQKQIGAYYTKEDITRYISQNTIIPLFFEKLKERCPEIFTPSGPVWALLQEDPDRYMLPAQKKGCALSLPVEIEAGIGAFSNREIWNEPASKEYALPGETWREVVARRQNYRRIRAYLNEGGIGSVDDLVTCNLDLCQFAQDVIMYVERPDVLLACYECLTKMTVLDPTCGSGAFLFAALNVLEPLYEACLDRMQAFVEASEFSTTLCSLSASSDQFFLCQFRDVLQQITSHPNRSFFIYKSIIMQNLYGVDLMREATEICKLRLFLKPISQIQTFAQIEPLPDIDFNIRAGNALVGFALYHEVGRIIEHDLGGLMLSEPLFRKITRHAQKVEQCFAEFRLFQMVQPVQPEQLARSKKRLRESLARLRIFFDYYLAAEYGIDRNNIKDRKEREKKFQHWKQNVAPFHWFLEFYGIVQNGGFDAVVGNPPYVAYNGVKDTYKLQFYETEPCGNLCAYTLERALALLRPGGRCGMIVPVSAISSESYRPLSKLLLRRRVWVSSYSNRPGKLFSGVEQRLAIILINNTHPPALFASPYRHWYEPERAHLFQTLSYTPSSTWSRTGMPLKSGTPLAEAIFSRLNRRSGFPLLRCERAEAAVWVHDGPTYWVRALPFEPNGGCGSARSNHYHKLPVSNQRDAFILAAVLSSSTFYLFYKLVSNCRDLGRRELRCFPLGDLQPELAEELAALGRSLAERLQATAARCSRRYASGVVIYEEYYPARGKALLDEIDRVLARHYGFNEEEVDFILNYEIKYRMGRDQARMPPA
jgi:hypothetical protein